MAGHACGGRARVCGGHAIGVNGTRRAFAWVGVEGHALANGIWIGPAASTEAARACTPARAIHPCVLNGQRIDRGSACAKANK